nr:MAG TPA: hypothetical protein [Caudoviricetes sp.]
MFFFACCINATVCKNQCADIIAISVIAFLLCILFQRCDCSLGNGHIKAIIVFTLELVSIIVIFSGHGNHSFKGSLPHLNVMRNTKHVQIMRIIFVQYYYCNHVMRMI